MLTWREGQLSNVMNKNNYPPIIEEAIDIIDTEWKWYFQGDFNWRQDLTFSNTQGKRFPESDWILAPSNKFSPLKESTPLKVAVSPSKETPLLYKLFIDLAPTKEYFLTFANTYGDLGNHEVFHPVDAPKESIFGERLSFWVIQYCLLKNAVRLWEWLQAETSRDIPLLFKKAKIDGHFNVVIGEPSDLSTIAEADYLTSADRLLPSEYHKGHTLNNFEETKFSVEYEPPLYLSVFSLTLGEIQPYFNPKSQRHFYVIKGGIGRDRLRGITDTGILARELALIILGRLINEQLRTYHVCSQVYYHTQKQAFLSKIVPSNLLSTLWLQFSQVITGERKIRQCPICRRWSDVTNVNRNWEKHRDCANWERVTKIRKMPIIRELVFSGMPLEEIARRVKVDSYNIGRWLAEDNIIAEGGE